MAGELKERQQWTIERLAAAPARSIAYEYEKRSYPTAIAQVIVGNVLGEETLTKLDPEAGSTLGIDLFSGFTLKVQMRKYFLLCKGGRLPLEHCDRMRSAFRLITTTDPATTPGIRREFWEGGEWCSTQADCRGTENLRLMVESSVYLMAEEVGGDVLGEYKGKLLERSRLTKALGLSEWNSAAYHGHGFSCWLNLWDFAQDPEVRAAAGEMLRWYSDRAAVKYWRGAWGHPSKRFYGDESGAARFFWVYFGDAPPPATVEPDWIHAATSSWEPTAGAIAVARREFEGIRVIRWSHPNYGRTATAYHETIVLGQGWEAAWLEEPGGVDWSSAGIRWLEEGALNSWKR